MDTLRICKRCNKKNIEEIEQKLPENKYEVTYGCIGMCGQELNVKVNGDNVSAESVDELISKL